MIFKRRIVGSLVFVALTALLLYAFYTCFRDYGFWTLLYIPETCILLMCIYVFLPAVIFFTGRSKIKKTFVSTLPERDTVHNFFTILIPAHNEERLLPALLESLLHQTYAREYYQVIVVADNCKDRTATIAELYGMHYLERFTKQASNKHEALQYAIENFEFTPCWQNGYICIMDADCEAHPDFLREMNQQLAANAKTEAIQSYRFVKNIYDSHITVLDGAGEALRNWVFSAPRKWIGTSVFGNGSGIVFRKQLFEKLLLLPGSHLAEDKEWNAYLAEHHTKVDYCACAQLGYEAVASKKDFHKQRKRWIGSHFAMMGKYGMKMFVQSITNLNVMQFDCFCALMQLPRSLLLMCCLFFSAFSFLLPQSSYLSLAGWLIVMISLVLYGVLGLYLVKARKKDYLAILSILGLMSGIIKTTFVSITGKGISQWNATRIKNE